MVVTTHIPPTSRRERLKQLADSLPDALSSTVRESCEAIHNDLDLLEKLTNLIYVDDVCTDEMVAYFATELDDPEAAIRQTALDALLHCFHVRGKPAISPSLFQRLATNRHPEARILALITIVPSAITDEELAFLTVSIQDSDTRVAGRAIGLVGAGGLATDEIISQLCKTVASMDLHRRTLAIMSLGALESHAAQAVPCLVADLKRGDERTGIHSANSLSRIDTAVAEPLRFLLEYYPKARGNLRRIAVEALARYQAQAAPVLECLVHDAEFGDEDLQDAATNAIREICMSG